jgi:hypothetical protein
MAKKKAVSVKKKTVKTAAKKLVKKAPAKKRIKANPLGIVEHWGLVSLNKNEAYIHVAFNTPITKKGLVKWSDGYLASLLEAKAMILNASIVNDWMIEKVEFAREDPDWREQDFPFWVGKNEPDKIYHEIIKLNSNI